jgi:enhancing lycopene biosynthesis protein 2
MTRVAVVLSGCGVFDGSEIHEACAALLALQRNGAEAVCCAPPGPQHHVIDHHAGEPADGESRDVRVESARIARGPVADLGEVDLDGIDAVLLPGGFGAAKNLCNFAIAGADCEVRPEVAEFLRGARAAGKPIGAMCIAPVILARLFGADRPHLTIGTDRGTAEALEAMGARHVDCDVRDCVVDETHGFVTTPAYMAATHIGEVFDGADRFVERLLSLVR